MKKWPYKRDCLSCGGQYLSIIIIYMSEHLKYNLIKGVAFGESDTTILMFIIVILYTNSNIAMGIGLNAMI